MTEPVIEIAGPIQGTDLPFSWKKLVDQTKPWGSCARRSYWFAALHEGEVVAVGAVDFESQWIGPSLVLPSHRGHGIQRQLLEARLSLARKHGVERLQTAVDITNAASLRNVLCAGFKVEHYVPDEDHLLVSWRNHD